MGWGVGLLGYTTTIASLNNLRILAGSDAVYVVGTNVTYSIHQELGTSRMQAQPFLFPAAREVGRELDGLAEEHGNGEDLLKAAALEIERRAKEKAPVDTGNLRASIRTEKVS